MANLTEIFKPIKGFEGLYSISNLGRVKSHERKTYHPLYKEQLIKERILKLFPDRQDYLKVSLCKNGKLKTYLLHRFIAEAFIPNPENKPCINHIDGCKTNNKISNLEWCTVSENNYHSYKLNLKKPLNKPVNQLDLNGTIIKRWESISDATNNLGICFSGVSGCLAGKKKTARGFKWQYS
jgi:hypothetical protein